MSIISKGNLVGKIEDKAQLKGHVAISKIQPSGTINITQNGITNVTDYANANVDIQPTLQNKDVTITRNETINIIPDSNYDGLSNVNIEVNVPSYLPDWSQIGYYETPLKIIRDYSYAKQIYDNWDDTQTDLFNKFRNDRQLIYMPLVYTGNVMYMTQMFYACSQLAYVPSLDTSNVRIMEGMFRDCSSIIAIPEFYTPNITTMRRMCMDCISLEYVPVMDTSNVENMSQMFYDCTKLTNESLYNILEMCINAQKVETKTLSYLSLTNDQIARCQTLSNWQDFLNAGWTA